MILKYLITLLYPILTLTIDTCCKFSTYDGFHRCQTGRCCIKSNKDICSEENYDCCLYTECYEGEGCKFSNYFVVLLSLLFITLIIYGIYILTKKNRKKRKNG